MANDIARINNELVQVGAWYWLKSEDKMNLVCCTHIGSNYATLTAPGDCSWRVHFDDFASECTLEPNGLQLCQEFAEAARQRVIATQREVQALVASLHIELTPGASGGDTALVPTAMAGASSPAEAEAALTVARDKTLPALFETIKTESKAMATWLSGAALPFQADMGLLGKLKKNISQQVFHIQLYAGLIEQCVQVREGTPAARHTPIHLHQRRHYMDEESLIDYAGVGLRYARLESFDAWLAQDANMRRILPHPRSVVAFRVRRSLWLKGIVSFSDWEIAQRDKLTFLYIRNGDQLWRLSTDIDFGEELFTDSHSALLSSQTLYVNRDKVITQDEYDAMDADDWERRFFRPLVPSSVYYDDDILVLRDHLHQHNRVQLILQGLLDRSAALQPNPGWRLWTEEAMQAIELVYDSSRALTNGEAPDFEAFRAACNRGLTKGAVTIGQEVAWEIAEGVKELQREDRWGSSRRSYDSREPGEWRFRPYGNPGPGKIAVVAGFRNGDPTYVWTRERLTRERTRWEGVQSRGKVLRTTCTVPRTAVLVIGGEYGYQRGDFHKFYDDPRTRADYLEWAPLLLGAEAYLARAAGAVDGASSASAPTKESDASDASDDDEDGDC